MLIKLTDGPLADRLTSYIDGDRWLGDGTGAIHRYRFEDGSARYVRSRGWVEIIGGKQ